MFYNVLYLLLAYHNHHKKCGNRKKFNNFLGFFNLINKLYNFIKI